MILTSASYPSLFAILDLIFPRLCPGCGKEISFKSTQPLCPLCQHQLPHTGFASIPDNPAERIFRGRIEIRGAHSEFYYSRESVIRSLIHGLKYKGKKETGVFLGKIIGESLQKSERFGMIELLLPLPLYADREYRRGYNQSACICEGISQVLKVPVESNAMTRIRNTATQTNKQRTERWMNVENSFRVAEPEKLRNRHVLLVDDVITTGASLEACALALGETDIASLSIATVAMANK
jgi:ComF family protein